MSKGEVHECLAALGLTDHLHGLVAPACELKKAMNQRPEKPTLWKLLLTVPPERLSRTLRKRRLPRVGYQEKSEKLAREYKQMFGHIAALAAHAARQRTNIEAEAGTGAGAEAGAEAELIRAFKMARKLATNVYYDLRAVAAKDPYFQAYQDLHDRMVSYLGNYLLNSPRKPLCDYTKRTRYHAIAEGVVGPCLTTCGFLPPQGFIKPSERLDLAYLEPTIEQVRMTHVELVANWLMPALREAMVILDLVPVQSLD